MSNVKMISHIVKKWLIRRLEWQKEKREKIIFCFWGPGKGGPVVELEKRNPVGPMRMELSGRPWTSNVWTFMSEEIINHVLTLHAFIRLPDSSPDKHLIFFLGHWGLLTFLGFQLIRLKSILIGSVD